MKNGEEIIKRGNNIIIPTNINAKQNIATNNLRIKVNIAAIRSKNARIMSSTYDSFLLPS